MTRDPMESMASELEHLARELESLAGAPDALDRASELLWRTADRLGPETGPVNDEPAGFVFPGPSLALPLLARIMN